MIFTKTFIFTAAVTTKYLENIIFMMSDIKHLNPHQATSVLGCIMPNNLSLNPTVSYRMNFFTTIVPYPWKVALYIASKTIQCENFYDNGGGYVHQSNAF